MLRSELTFGSFLAYSPRGDSAEATKSRDVCYALKSDVMVDQPPIALSKWLMRKLRDGLPGSPIAQLFGSDVTAVPVPGSRLSLEGGLWVSLNIAEALVAVGLCRQVSTCLRRVAPIRKAATSGAATRPKPAEHVESFGVQPELLLTRRLLLVDDVVTRGATLIAAASKLAAVYPAADIAGFAAVRTVSDPAASERIQDARLGTITYRPESGDTIRRP